MPVYTLFTTALFAGFAFGTGGFRARTGRRAFWLLGIPAIALSLLVDLVGPVHFFGGERPGRGPRTDSSPREHLRYRKTMTPTTHYQGGIHV